MQVSGYIYIIYIVLGGYIYIYIYIYEVPSYHIVEIGFCSELRHGERYAMNQRGNNEHACIA